MASQRGLFGGAITIELPSTFIDASTLRQVPDTQEVFISPSDVSFVIEILERVDPDDPKEAVKFHFDSLAHDNDAINSHVLDIRLPEDNTAASSSSPETTPSPVLLEGSQQIAKFNSRHKDDVRVLLAVYRIARKRVDLVFSANVPLTTETGEGNNQEDVDNAKELFIAAARSLTIVDFDLFA
ncbi:hypothetical protein M0805_009299 [Coniferiporia weirii]|nr:hypothetical protein M0805_009299 [Coniferiporia weirii]